ncbi:MAG: alpha/beta fold hydrolase, partial [Verrucomicrobiota bacterium]
MVVWISALVLLAVLVLVVWAVWEGSNVMLFPKRRELEQRHLDVLNSPSTFGIELESFTAKMDDGVGLKGYLVTRSANMGEAARTREMLVRLENYGIESSAEPRGTVILLHGRGGLKDNMLTIAQRFVAADFRCIVYDARAHGESGGKHSTFGSKETGDASQVLDHVSSLLEERGEELGPVMGFGLSLGAANLVRWMPDEERLVAGVVVAPFADLTEVVVHAGKRDFVSWLPAALPKLVAQIAGMRGGYRAKEICPELAAKSVQQPGFIVHGDLDQVIPLDHGKRVYDALPHQNKRWEVVEGGYHGDVLATGGADLYYSMIQFYLEHLPKP